MQAMHERRDYAKGFPLFAGTARNLEFMAHWHVDIELLHVVSGTISATVNQERRTLGEGSLVACGSRDIHFYERAGADSETILVIFKPEILGHAPLWPSAGRLAGNFATRDEHPELADASRRIMKGILEEMDSRERAFGGVARGMAMELCGRVERELSGDEAGGRRAGPAGPGGFPALERMQRAIDFMYERSAYPISLADAAAAASLSPSYFSRVFSKTVGAGFRAFLNGIRIEQAEELMSSTSATLADISLECGFESVRTFNRAYRALRGASPSSARR